MPQDGDTVETTKRRSNEAREQVGYDVTPGVRLSTKFISRPAADVAKNVKWQERESRS